MQKRACAKTFPMHVWFYPVEVILHREFESLHVYLQDAGRGRVVMHRQSPVHRNLESITNYHQSDEEYMKTVIQTVFQLTYAEPNMC